MNKRQLNLEKYGISGKRYKELCGFCEQYPEWKNQLKFSNDSQYIIKSVCYEVPVTYLIACEGMPIGKSAFYEMRRYFFYLLDKNKAM